MDTSRATSLVSVYHQCETHFYMAQKNLENEWAAAMLTPPILKLTSSVPGPCLLLTVFTQLEAFHGRQHLLCSQLYASEANQRDPVQKKSGADIW